MAPAPTPSNKLPPSLPCCSVLLLLITITVPAGSQWINHGGDLMNRRFAEGEAKITVASVVSKLQLKWKFLAGKDITATPAIFEGTLYFPCWNGKVYAVRATDGSLVWERSLGELTGLNATGFIFNVNTSVARATPTMAGDLLIIGVYGPAVVVALERESGKLVWITQIDHHPTALVTMSGTTYNGNAFAQRDFLPCRKVFQESTTHLEYPLNRLDCCSLENECPKGFYVGTSSFEGVSIENCCIFRGSLAKLNVRSGAILWQTYVLTENNGKLGGYAGAAAIWGSGPSIDTTRYLVFVATGNLYAAPKHVLDCQERLNNRTNPSSPSDECIETVNHGDSILAFDLDDGRIRWFRQLGGYDVYFGDCANTSNPRCPPGPNVDADFGEAPMMLSVDMANGTRMDIVVAMQKSGVAWALNRDNGEIEWYTKAGPGGLAGGGTWGAATDGIRVYTNIANSNGITFTLTPSNINTTAGAWVAMDAATGKILWSTANPRNVTSNGPVTVANGVLFAGSVDPKGALFAFDALTGQLLWSYDTDATVYGGASVSNGCVYLGNGYNVNLGGNLAIAGTSLFAFCVET